MTSQSDVRAIRLRARGSGIVAWVAALTWTAVAVAQAPFGPSPLPGTDVPPAASATPLPYSPLGYQPSYLPPESQLNPGAPVGFEMMPPQGAPEVPWQPGPLMTPPGYPETGSYPVSNSEPWTLQLLPDGIIYQNYLAGVRESRMASVWNYENNLGWIWDISLGGRASILRYGTTDGVQPEGWELGIEGAGLPRLDIEGGERDLVAVDFRFGTPITYGNGPYQTKFAYYHLSSHMGDEWMVKHPGLNRVNFARDVLVWGHSYYLTPSLRVYGEAGWAFFSDVSEPWEFQFGIDYAPAVPTGFRGAPFAAVNGHLRQENNFGGNFVVQAGWAWRGGNGNHLFRTGLQYFNGHSEQYEFWNETEQKLGLGIWYDF